MAEEGSVENAETSSPSLNKPVIMFNAFGLPIGDHSIKLSSRCGELVRTHVPISIKDWRAVPNSKKDELWKFLQEEFVVPQSYKDKCLKGMSDMFRKFKAKLRLRYLDPYTTYDDRVENCPPGVSSDDWEAFIQHNLDPKTVEQREKNAKVRKGLDIYHTSGRHGHARLEDKLKRQKKDGDPPLTRAEVWIQAHTKKDGSIPNNVSSRIERVKELLSSQGEVNSHNILNDPLTQVFGVDTRGRVRGVGNVCRTQIVGSSTTLEMMSLSEKNLDDQSTALKNLESKMQYLIEEFASLKQLILATFPTNNTRSRSPQQEVDVNPVIEWLHTLGLSKYEEAFIKEEIDLEALQWLTEEDLLSLGVTALGPRKKIVHALTEMKKGSAHAEDAQSDTSKGYHEPPERNNKFSVRKTRTVRKHARNAKLGDFPPWS